MRTVADETSEQFQRRCLKEAGISYGVGAVLPVLVSLIFSLALSAVQGAEEQNWFCYLSFLLPQVCLAATAAIYFYRSKDSVKGMCSGCKWYWFPVALILQFGLLFSLSELNTLFIGLLESIGYEETLGALPVLSGWNILPALLVVALLPAIFEETLFRGIITRNMGRSGWGIFAAAFLSGALFSLFHGNPSQTLYQFICGVCFALVYLRAGSIFPAMLSHFCNNAVILLLTQQYGEVPFSALLPKGGYIALTVVAALCLVAAVCFLVLFGRRKEGYMKREDWRMKEGKTFVLPALAGVFVCAVQWIVMLVTGFI